MLSKGEWVARYNTVYNTVGDYFFKCSWCRKEYWSWQAANVLESLIAMYRGTRDNYYLNEAVKQVTFILDNEGGYGKTDWNFTGNIFCPIIKLLRLIHEQKITALYPLRDRILQFAENYVIPYVKAGMVEFQLDGKNMVTVTEKISTTGNVRPIPFNQQDQIFVMLLHLSYVVNKAEYRQMFVKYTNFVKWARVLKPSCYDNSKQIYTLAYRRYTGLQWDFSQGMWCSEGNCTMEINYANYHVDLVMEGLFNNIGFSGTDAQLLTNTVLEMWNHDDNAPVLHENLGFCGKNIVPYTDIQFGTKTGTAYNFARLGIIDRKALEIIDRIEDKIFTVGTATDRYFTKTYQCLLHSSGQLVCYGNVEEGPDALLRAIANIIVTSQGEPPGPGPRMGGTNILPILIGIPLLGWLFTKKDKKK